MGGWMDGWVDGWMEESRRGRKGGKRRWVGDGECG